MSFLTEQTVVERESKMLALCYSMLSDVGSDLSDARQSVVQTCKRNAELEKLTSQLVFENGRLKEKLNVALKRLDETEGLHRKNEMIILAEVDQARQAAAGEIERALGGLRNSTEMSMQFEDRALRAEARTQELQQASTESHHSVLRLQQQLSEANQLAASLQRRLEESDRYTRTLESALGEIKLSTSEGQWT